MENTKVTLDNKGFGEVQLFDNDIKAGKMDVAITNGKLTVFHTEVSPEFEGRGFAKVLLNQLVSYAKANSLKIIPLCPYVNLQFRRHPAEYEDVWSKSAEVTGDNDFRGFDGAEWILEDSTKNNYHFTTRWSPEKTGGYAKCCLYFLKLSRITINENEIY